MQSDSHALVRVIGKDVIAEMARMCLLMRTRLISRVIAGIYDEQFRPFGIGAAQFVLLVAIYKMEPATRAEIGRFLHQDRSILTRNLKLIISEGWVVEKQGLGDGRSRPLVLTTAAMGLLRKTEPAWHAAQAQAKALLGKDGVIAIVDIANRIMDPTA